MSKYELYMQVDAVQRFLADIYDKEQLEAKKRKKPQPPQNKKKERNR